MGWFVVGSNVLLLLVTQCGSTALVLVNGYTDFCQAWAQSLRGKT